MLIPKYDILLRFTVRYIEKCSVYLLEMKIQITDIFDFYLLGQNQDLIKNCENVIQEWKVNIKWDTTTFMSLLPIANPVGGDVPPIQSSVNFYFDKIL